MSNKIKTIDRNTRFTRLTVLEDLGLVAVSKIKNRHMCKMLCDCGKVKIIRLDQLKSGMTKSCGCLQKEFCYTGKARFKHGDAGTRFHKAWQNMLSRSNKELQNKYYKTYGDLNIKVCKKWEEYIAFKEDMYELYKKHVLDNSERDTTLDRINPHKGYSKENCRWANYKIQANNKIKKYDTK